MIRFRIICNKDINRISKIWLKTQPYSIMAILGKKFIYIYMQLLLKDPNKNFGILALHRKKIAGFILFGNDKFIIKSLLLNNIFQIFSIFIKNLVFFNFKKIYYFFKIIILIVVRSILKNNKKNSSELLFLSVLKSYRNQKIAKNLLNESLQYLKKFKIIFTMTSKDNFEALKFYNKMKFIKSYTLFDKIFLYRKMN